MAVAPEAEALLRGMYDAFNRKDIRTALAAAHPEVNWPNGLDGTRVTGLEQIAEYVERQFRVIDLQFDIQSLREDGDDPEAVVVRVHQVGSFLSDGAVLVDEVVEHIYRLRDGQVISMDVRGADGKLVVPRQRHSSDA
jgi:ketosteroid isomerase-like protein